MQEILKKAGKVLLWITGISFLLVAISAIVHAILTPKEKEKMRSRLGDKLKFVEINGEKIAAYITGSGKKTIVMLSGLGTGSPIGDFMPLADRLSADFRVVTLEFYGYGFSDQTAAPRTNAAFISEIRGALKKLDIAPPYILMPHSISGVYSMYYAIHHPDEVEAIIGIDESKPDQANSGPISKKKAGLIPSFVSFLNSTGIFRAIVFLFPGLMKEYDNSRYYSEEQKQLVKSATVWNLYNGDIVNEANSIYPNCQELFGVKYPSGLPTLSFLAQGSIDGFKKMAEKKSSDADWLLLHEAVISNPAIQKIEVLEGKHYLHHTQADKMVTLTKEFVAACVK
jgi:pimeloyl-ACP methyl ester carboxylesterase